MAFTIREANDAEGLALDAQSPAASRFVREWSNFRGGDYWWIQSLYIVPEHRGTGLIDRLLDHVAHAAQEAGALDLRLYADASNDRAQRAYHRCGFTRAPYVIMTPRP